MRRVLAVGAVLVLASIPSPPRAGAAGESFGGYQATASGVAASMAPRIPALLPVETPVEGTLSLAFASLASGGAGFGRSSIVFPGTPIAGLRPLLEIAIGQPIPIPDYPLVVESREHEDIVRGTQPGITMESDVDPDRATVTTDIGGTSIPGVIAIGSVRTVSEVMLTDVLVSAASRTVVSDVDILGGMVHIGSIESTASASSDAVTATCGGSFAVSGATVAGTAVRIDESGVHSDGSPLLPGLDLNPIVAAILAATDLDLRVLSASESCAGAAANRSTGGLLVSYPLPAIGALPPGGSFNILFGSTSATASANLPFDVAAEPPPVDRPDGSSTSPFSPGFVPGFGLPPAAIGGAAPPALPPTPILPVVEPVDYEFDGVPVTLVVGLVLIAVAGSRTVRRYLERVMSISTKGVP